MNCQCHTRKMKKNKLGVCGGIGNHHYLPDDVLIEFILRRLPLPCLFRCAAVCRTWRRLVTETHALYGGTTMTKHALAVSSYPIINERWTPTIRVFVPNTDEHIIRQYSPEWLLCDVTNGFLLCYSSASIKGRRLGFNVCLRVCNPLTNKSVPLPRISLFHNSPLFHFRMLIFDPTISHHYKVIAFSGRILFSEDGGRNVYDKVCVFSSQQAHLGWLPLESDVPALLNRVASGSIDESFSTVCLNGYAYRLGYKTVDDFSRFYHNLVMSIDGKELRFEFIDSPPALDVPAVGGNVWSRLDKAQDCLQYTCNDEKNVRIWRLREDGRSWALRHTICLPDDLSYYPKGACLLYVHGDDQVLLYSNADRFVFQYDMKRLGLGYYLGSDGKRVRGGTNSFCTFIYCAIDPEFRRMVLRPPK